MKTLVLAYPGCIGYEVMLATELLCEQLPVRVTTPDGSAFVNSNGMTIASDMAYKDVDPSVFRCVLVPGGNPDGIVDDPEVDRIVQTALKHDALIGGICAGVLVLAKTGILRGRRATHNYTHDLAPREIADATAHFWTELEYAHQPVVVDGNVITALPQAHIEFAVTVARELGIVSEEHAVGLQRYYAGQGADEATG